MYHATQIFPEARDVSTSIFDGSRNRLWFVNLGPAGSGVSILIRDRATLDAFDAALDAIWADMNAAEQAARDQVPTEMADWPAGPPGEALGVFGK